MRSIIGESVSGLRSHRVPGVGIVRYQLLPILLAGTLGCNTDSQFAPSSEPDPLSPRFASVTAPTEITIWEGNISYTLTASTRELRSSDGRQVFLDDELTANVRSAFQSILEGDVLAPAIESLVGPGGSEQPEPYRTGERSPDEPSHGDVVFVSGQFSRGTGRPLSVRIIRGRRGYRQGTDEEVSLTSVDACGDIAGSLLNTATSFRQERNKYVTKLREILWDRTVGERITSAASDVFTQIALPLNFSRINMGIMGTLWNSYGCRNQTVFASGFVMTSLEPGPQGVADSDGITTLYCTWSSEWVYINGQYHDVWLRVCSFKPQSQ
jgi:hypothetical protein